MKFIDTHCHPYLLKVKDKGDAIQNFTKAGGGFFVSIGVDLPTSLTSLRFVSKYPFGRTSVGIHPCDIKDLSLIDTISKLEKIYLSNKDKVVAIGETGLDYYWMEKDAEKLIEKILDEEKRNEIKKKYISDSQSLQQVFFRAHIALARQYSLPLVIHNRNAKQDIIRILKEEGYQNFIMHCFAENLEFARECIAFAPNCMISFSGIVTFKNALDIQDAAKNIPLKNIIIETDSPYLTPTPYRGKEENEPAFTQYVLKKIQELRTESPDTIEKQLYKNSLDIFNIS